MASTQNIKTNRIVATILVTVALALSLTASGCGGGSSAAADSQKSAGHEPTITRVALIKKGDAICRHTDVVQKERLTAYEKKHKGVSLIVTSAQEKALVYAALPPIATEIEGVAALGSPAGEKGAVDAIISGWRGALKRMEQKPSLLLGATEGPFTEPDKLAKAYGFKDCAQAL